ncbi:type IX secretion system sortase PorU, partial [Bacteroidales bacterium OttesenSCG-928-K03]|nr:type IX secretion system sortase PorU [Bacteroidales bacterium OttesenSCG-928-K03]
KFFVSEDGMYKITYQDLKSLGVDVDNINPKTIQIFGNGGGMLPELAGAERYDDLNEVPIWVIGEEDGKFNNNDYILFYGSGPDSWTLEDKMFMFNRNLYTRKSGYFLTYSQTNGRRIENRESIVGKPNQTVTEFIDYQARETATSCPNKSGKKWYGETFDINTQQTFTFSFKNVNKNKSAKMFYEAAGRQFSRASFVTNVDNYSRTFTFDPVGTSLGSIYARTGTDYATFTPSSDNINVNMKYNRASSGDIAWLRCIYINVYSQLNYSSGNLFFRNDTSTLSGNVVEYKISTSSNIGNIKILDITKPAEPTQVIFTNNQSNITFPFYTDKVYQYICFDGSDTKSVEFQGGKIPNQNIHGKDIPDMVIVYKDILKDEVYRLYDFHVQTGLKTHMIDIQDIYNEFSSGVPDLCAIRDMMKMWYDKASYGNEPKYLLLVGRASYDPLDRINSNTNDILIHQSFDNMAALSVCTDDFYGYMDDNEGLFKNGDALDIAVGRIPTGFSHEVKNIIDKILHYTSNTESQQGDWKNIITFVADDADDNEDYHLRWAETYASIIEENHKEFNVNKIYAGAYTQITTAGGQRYPDVTAEINARLDKGTLIFVYSGHGGIKQLALEQLVSIADINSWKNYDRLTFFATATCSFTVFDDPGTISAGEMVLLNKKGGAVGMFTTTRITGSGNDALFRNFSRRIYKRDSNNNFKNIGDIIRETKNFQSTVIPNTRAYALLGDPAIPLNYPKYNSVNITKMLVDGVESDTLKAFSIVEIEGEVLDLYGNLMSDYNGIIYPEIHDKPLLLNTLGNDGADIQSFYSDNSIIYKGKSNIIDGKFKFSFIVPKDIAYKFGTAKMSFYYTNNEVDGNGYFDKYIVGGNTNPTEHDTQGPDIELYINDTLFINGGYTNENPVLLAKLFDKSGINTTGNGIGHDIIAYLDENTDRMYLMNTFYESDIDSYQSGKIRYPMFNLGSGLHKISIRAWDTYNNSSTADIEFLVISSDTIFLSDIYNYPNPFFDETTFVISHNQSGNIISASLYIASLSGQIINKIEKTFTSNNSNEKFLIWDGKTKNGTSINPGIYIYKIVLNNDSGKTTTRSGKLIKTISK